MVPGASDDEIVSFSRPPVVEVVYGAQFHALPLQTVHYGRFWDRIRQTYQKTLDVPPLPSILETPAGQSAVGIFTVSPLPDLRRVFFVDEEHGRMLQLQPNRFHHNWRRRTDVEPYPRFRELRPQFVDRWREFLTFLEDEGLPPPHVTQGEMTYINQMPFGELWDDAGLARLFPWLTPRNPALPAAPGVEVALHFEAPELHGRVHITIGMATPPKDGQRVVQMELTARGAPDNLEQWLVAARSAIVRSFVELTGADAHAHWGRVT